MYEILRFHSEDQKETVVGEAKTLADARKAMKQMAVDAAGKDGKITTRNSKLDVWVDFGMWVISFHIADTKLAPAKVAPVARKIDGKQFAAKVNRTYAKLNGAKMVDNGYRVRQTPECLQYGEDVIEVSSSFYYRNQASLTQAVGQVLYHGHHSNINFELDDLVMVRDAQEDWQQWPKTSWVTALYRITEAEYYDDDEAEWNE